MRNEAQRTLSKPPTHLLKQAGDTWRGGAGACAPSARSDRTANMREATFDGWGKRYMWPPWMRSLLASFYKEGLKWRFWVVASVDRALSPEATTRSYVISRCSMSTSKIHSMSRLQTNNLQFQTAWVKARRTITITLLNLDAHPPIGKGAGCAR